jgi:site-specific recombinase XerD
MTNSFNFQTDSFVLNYDSVGGKGEEDNFVGMSMNDRLREYKKFLCGEHTKRKTIQQYFTSAKKFYTFCKGDINEQNKMEYKHHLNQHYAKHNSRRIRLHGANMFLRYLKYTELYQIPKEEYTNQQTITEEQIDKILEISIVNPELHLILLFLWDGCIRNGSIVDAKISDRQGNRLNLFNTKTGDRHIVMSAKLQDAWNNYLIHRPTPKPEYEDYLLIRSNGDRYKDIQHVTDTIKEIGKVAGIPHKITPYTIRRTSATLRQSKFSKYYAGDPKIVQMMFNHTDIKTTMRYNQKTDNDIEQYLSAIYTPDKSDKKIYPVDIRGKTQDKSYLSAEKKLKDLWRNEEDNTSFSFSFSFDDFFDELLTGNSSKSHESQTFVYDDDTSFLNPGLGYQACCTSHLFLRSIETNQLIRRLSTNLTKFVSICPAPPSSLIPCDASLTQLGGSKEIIFFYLSSHLPLATSAIPLKKEGY